MPWVRLEDTFPEHPKIDAAGGDAGWLHVCAIAYCNRNTTDGFIANQRLPQLSDRKQPARLAARLVECGLWEIDPRGGWQIHDYLDYQPSKATIDKERAEARERMRKARESKGGSGNVRANIDRSSGNVRVTQPDPSQPDPSYSLSFDTSSPSTRTPEGGEEDKKIREALDLYADHETELKATGNKSKYKKAVLENPTHYSVMYALAGQRPSCTAHQLAHAYINDGWPVHREQAPRHPKHCGCRGVGQRRDEGGYMVPCDGLNPHLRLA